MLSVFVISFGYLHVSLWLFDIVSEQPLVFMEHTNYINILFVLYRLKIKPAMIILTCKQPLKNRVVACPFSIQQIRLWYILNIQSKINNHYNKRILLK